jgi:hypothetical protein
MHKALIVLNNLSLEAEARIRMVQMGILEALANVVVFECPGTDWQARALGIVSSIALLQEPDVQQAIISSGIIQSVNTVLLHYSYFLFLQEQIKKIIIIIRRFDRHHPGPIRSNTRRARL